ncbi:MAG: hypothetical protein FJW30_14390 [Acidobacteria bacterium]|nr:hypothetical protein [Acidobacteriota bacterium]
MDTLLAILNVFIDPAETVRRIEGKKLAWLAPLLAGGLIMAFYQWNTAHFAFEAMRADPPQGIDAAAIEKMSANMETMSRFSAITAPMMWALMALFTAALTFAACAVTSTNVRFPAVFALVAHTSLIKAIQLVAHYFVIKGKGEVSSMQDLRPSFGLEMLLPEGVNKLVYGFVSFFSVFHVWHVVILALGLAALAKCGKGRAFGVTAPDWIVGLIFTMIGALFMRT